VSLSRQPQLGSVVWTELEDSNGYRKVRPVVVVTPTAEITAGKPLRVVAITTRLPNPLPDDHVLLPGDRQGKARSGLRRPCAAVATWQAEVPVCDIHEVVGVLPPTTIRELLEKVASPLPSPAAAPASQPDDSDTGSADDSMTTPSAIVEAGQEPRSDEIA
jgi:mRNA-degrading endonuclease toxin of MazEF toxin-antitoxin module